MVGVITATLRVKGMKNSHNSSSTSKYLKVWPTNRLPFQGWQQEINPCS